MTTPLAPCGSNTARIESRSSRSASTPSRSSGARGRGGPSSPSSSSWDPAPSSSRGSSALTAAPPASSLFLWVSLDLWLPEPEGAERLRVLDASGRPAFLGSLPDPLFDRPVMDLALVTAQRFDLRADRLGDVDERVSVGAPHRHPQVR